MITERLRHTLPVPVHIEQGDMLECTIQDRETMRQYGYRQKIDRSMVVDTLVTFDVSDELGLAVGVGGVFGVNK